MKISRLLPAILRDLRGSAPRLLYVIPTYQNPVGGVLGLSILLMRRAVLPSGSSSSFVSFFVHDSLTPPSCCSAIS